MIVSIRNEQQYILFSDSLTSKVQIQQQLSSNMQNERTSLQSPTLPKNVPQQLTLILRVGASLKKWKKIASTSKDRYNRLKELVTTQEDYHNDLVTIRSKIKKELEAEGLITTSQSSQMFPNLDGMIDLSDQIYRQFREILQGWNRKTTQIGKSMIKYSRFLMIYSDFFKNYKETEEKLKILTSKSERAKRIEKNLSTAFKIVTIGDLISKPFQRPLKYHLLLRDYWSKTPLDHPDQLPLKEAIQCYHKVNEQNNLSLQNKDKSQTMVSLDAKFGNIIQAQARYYITQYDAMCLDIPVVMYLFSDLAIFVHKKLADKEFIRLQFNKYSHVEIAGDYSLFKNRLFFYGRQNCVHLTFAAKALRDEVFMTIHKLITQISEKETVREATINERLSSSRKSLQRKFSFTNLDPQLVRPINVEILGMETRAFGEENIRYFYIIEFHPAHANSRKNYSPHHISLLQQQTILELEKNTQLLYPNELKCLPICYIPKNLVSDYEYKKSFTRRIELKTIFITLFLNCLFRSPQVIKRIDYILHRLQVSDPIWNFLKINNQNCSCHACSQLPEIKNYDDYFKELNLRSYEKLHPDSRYKKTEYCEMRTIAAHEKFSQLYPEMLYKARTSEKIAWIKSILGKINHNLTNTRPLSPYTDIVKIKVTMRGFPNDYEYDIKCTLNDRARKIVTMVSHRREFNLEDYVLVASINGKAVIMEDDEPLLNLEKKKDPENFLETIHSFFSRKEDYPIKFYIEKYWVIFSGKDYLGADKTRRMKLNYEVEAIMKRLYNQEIKVADQDMLEFYALFLCKRYYGEYKTFTPDKVAMKIRNRAQIFFPPRLHEESAISRLFKKIEKYREDALIKSDFDFALRIVQKAAAKPGWSCIMERVLLETGTSKPVNVYFGCDLRGLKVREKNKIGLMLQFKFQDDNWSHHTKGQTLIISDGSNVFNFTGRQVWKVHKQIQFYQLYIKSFGFA